MANAVGGIGGSAFGGLAGSAQNTASSLMSMGQRKLDYYFPPDKRAVLWAKFNKFMTERPKLGAFLLSQLALSGIPLGIFIVMSITVALFSIIAALLVALLGSLLFIAFWVGVALIFLLPTLFFTTMVATFLFLWGLGAYYIIKWFNEKEIPGIHTDLAGGVKKKLFEDTGEANEADKVPALTGAHSEPPSQDSKAHASQETSQPQNGHVKKETKDGHKNNAVQSSKANGDAFSGTKKKVDSESVSKTAGNVKDSVPGGVI